MSMHHDLAERLGAIEERLPDPDEIFFLLRGKRHAGFHASMDEEIIAERDAELQILEEFEMRPGQRFGECPAPCLRVRAKADYGPGADAIGAHRRLAAIHEPMLEPP